MSTPLTHAVASLAAGKAFMPAGMPARFWLLAALCATLPDVDCLGFSVGIAYGHPLGHRGLTHSLPFALVLSLAVTRLGFAGVRAFSRRWGGLWVFFFLVAASHGVLDAMTDGGLGVAFFWPFSNARYFLPWRPLRVSPIGLAAIAEPWGRRAMVEVLKSEIVWVWVPSIAAVVCAAFCRRVFAAKPGRLAESRAHARAARSRNDRPDAGDGPGR